MSLPPANELRTRALKRVAPGNTAVIVVDMEYDFVDPSAPLAAEGAEEIIPAISGLLEAAHDAGIPVIYIVERHRPGEWDYGIQLEVEPLHCVEGTRGAEIVKELEPRPEEPLIVKRRYDGFFETELRLLLKDLGVKNLFFTGVCTELCVASTAYHAKSLDYRNFFVRECLAGVTKETHEAGLLCFEPFIGYVVSLEDARSRLLGALEEAPVT
jgi:biuret amidohydrolase